MSTTKSGGKARQGTPRKGRRLGVKLYSGEAVKTGQVIVRQIGATFHSGEGTGIGRDFTLFAQKDGKVHFAKSKGKNIVKIK